jgi:hypothetical protein
MAHKYTQSPEVIAKHIPSLGEVRLYHLNGKYWAFKMDDELAKKFIEFMNIDPYADLTPGEYELSIIKESK